MGLASPSVVPMQKLAAWAVHVYTAVGSVLALAMVHYAYLGDEQTVLWLFLAAMIVDGTDGFMARHFQVKEHVPEFDGALLDNIVDYITYAFAPDGAAVGATATCPTALSAAALAARPAAGVVLPVLPGPTRRPTTTSSSASRATGTSWPSTSSWSACRRPSRPCCCSPSPCWCSCPSKYVYPSRTEDLWYLNMSFSVAWLAVFGVIVAQLPDPSTALIVISLAYPVYYVAVSLWLTAKTAHRTHKLNAEGRPSDEAATR